MVSEQVRPICVSIDTNSFFSYIGCWKEHCWKGEGNVLSIKGGHWFSPPAVSICLAKKLFHRSDLSLGKGKHILFIGQQRVVQHTRMNKVIPLLGRPAEEDLPPNAKVLVVYAKLSLCSVHTTSYLVRQTITLQHLGDKPKKGGCQPWMCFDYRLFIFRIVFMRTLRPPCTSTIGSSCQGRDKHNSNIE